MYKISFEQEILKLNNNDIDLYSEAGIDQMFNKLSNIRAKIMKAVIQINEDSFLNLLTGEKPQHLCHWRSEMIDFTV
uniref:Uncharacterized protein n=1 Tax=Panagrolaimus superbus TaxID=310955 RepID=A0A914XZ17_9BILA